MSIEEEIERLDPRLAESPLCARLTESQDAVVRKIAAGHGVSVAVIMRILVARALRKS